MSEKLRGSAYRGGNDRATRLACLRNHETAGVGIGGQDEYLRLLQQRLRRLDRPYEMRRSREADGGDAVWASGLKTPTGEGLPVTRGRGEAVFAATVIRDGQLAIKAMRVGSETILAVG